MRAFFLRLGARFIRNRREQDWLAEFESHLQLHIDDNLRAGMSPSQARREALLKFGGLETVKESMRDRSTLQWLESTIQDIRYALRGLQHNPGFSITAILSLALGIGASLAIFTVTDNLLIRPLPFRDAASLAIVWEKSPRTEHNVISPANYLDWKKQNTVFESMGAFFDTRSVLNDGVHNEELNKQLVSAELLPMLGVQPIRGRLFTAADDAPNAPNVEVISYHLWQTWFGGDENIIGRKVQVNSNPATIIGVMPPGFYFRKRDTDFWETLNLNPVQRRTGRWMMAAARLKPGASMEAAQRQMSDIAQRLATDYPQFDKNWGITVEPVRDSMVREVKSSLWVLQGAVALLLAVACANVANLLLARYTSRRREMAVRSSLGAGRARVIRQLLTESLLLGLAGGLGGVLVARLAVKGLLALAPKYLVQGVAITMDLRILVVAVGLSVLTGILFGLAPALVTSRAGLIRGLSEGARSIGSGGRLRSLLVGAEVALSVILLLGATLLFRSLVGLQSVKPGLDPTNVLTFRVSIPAARYRELPRRIQFFTRAIEQMGQLPGVRSASAVSYLPFDGMAAGTGVSIEGEPPAAPGQQRVTVVRTVFPGYFRTLGIPIKSGRDFTAADNDPATPYRFIVNEAFVHKYLANQDPFGKRISVYMDDKNPFGEIVGVTGDVKEGSVDAEPSPTVYYVAAHLSYTSQAFVVRFDGSGGMSRLEDVRRVIHGLDAEQPISQPRLMEDIVAETFARQRFSALLFSGFSLTSLLLAAIGIYGVLAYSVTERTREIGVRVALGAEPGRIASLVLGTGARLVAIGTALGIAGGLALSGLLKGLLFGVGPRDPATFLVAPAMLAVVGLIAAYVPAHRASRMNPNDALRSE